jgi:carbon-monoxide dehydrogenase large subunit
VQTGIVTLLDHWVVHDCGFVINPLLLDEQIRGGVVQGMGGALFEEIVYDDQGQMLTATMADYLVPMASEIPDIDITRIEKPMGTETLGAKGVGEAGTAGAVGAILCAINDALVPLDAKITQTPCTPERILKSLK